MQKRMKRPKKHHGNMFQNSVDVLDAIPKKFSRFPREDFLILLEKC